MIRISFCHYQKSVLRIVSLIVKLWNEVEISREKVLSLLWRLVPATGTPLKTIPSPPSHVHQENALGKGQSTTDNRQETRQESESRERTDCEFVTFQRNPQDLFYFCLARSIMQVESAASNRKVGLWMGQATRRGPSQLVGGRNGNTSRHHQHQHPHNNSHEEEDDTEGDYDKEDTSSSLSEFVHPRHLLVETSKPKSNNSNVSASSRQSRGALPSWVKITPLPLLTSCCAPPPLKNQSSMLWLL